jgi:hypothetical protein
MARGKGSKSARHRGKQRPKALVRISSNAVESATRGASFSGHTDVERHTVSNQLCDGTRQGCKAHEKAAPKGACSNQFECRGICDMGGHHRGSLFGHTDVEKAHRFLSAFLPWHAPRLQAVESAIGPGGGHHSSLSGHTDVEMRMAAGAHDPVADGCHESVAGLGPRLRVGLTTRTTSA